MPIIQQSIDLVKSKIGGTRKGTDDRPNYDHSLRVYESLKQHGFDEDTQIAGLLHDIIEDGGMTLEELRELGYSDDILHLVDLSTHDSLVEDKFERWQKMLARLMQEGNKQAWAVKLADISDNLTECHLMPKPEKKERFLNKKCPVFVYYGNKYFGGTEFYNEFLERYFEQMKEYNQYFIKKVVGRTGNSKEITKEEFKKMFFGPGKGLTLDYWDQIYEKDVGKKYFFSEPKPNATRLFMVGDHSYVEAIWKTDEEEERFFWRPGEE